MHFLRRIQRSVSCTVVQSLRETTPRTILSARAVSGNARCKSGSFSTREGPGPVMPTCTTVDVGTFVISVPGGRLQFLQP